MMWIQTRSTLKRVLPGFLPALLLWSSLSLPAQADLKSNLEHLPASSGGLLTLDLSPQSWDYFLNHAPFKDWIQEFSQNFDQNLQASTGFSLKDVQPFLGSHLTLSFSGKGKQMLPLVAIDLKDPQAMAQRLMQIHRAAPQRLRLEIYQKSALFTGPQSPTQGASPASFAIRGHTLLLSSRPELLQALNPKQVSVLHDPQFVKTVNQLKAAKIWIYLKPDQLSSALQAIPDPKTQVMAENMHQALSIYENLGLGINPSPRGMVVKSVAQLKRQGLTASQKALQNQVLQVWLKSGEPLRPLLQGSPENSQFFLGWDGLQLMSEGLKTGGVDSQKALKSLNTQVQQMTGLDWQKDFLSHTDGRLGITLLKGSSPGQIPDFLLQVGLKDRAAMLKVLTQKLRFNPNPATGQHASGQSKTGPLYFESKPFASYSGFPIYHLHHNAGSQPLKKELGLEPVFTYSDQILILANRPDVLKQGLDSLKGKSNTLQEQAYFSRMQQALDLQNRGSLLYIDFQSLLQTLANSSNDNRLRRLLPALRGLKSFMAGGRYNDGMIEGIFMLDMNFADIDFKYLQDQLKKTER